MQGRDDEEGTASALPETALGPAADSPAEASSEPRADTAVSPVIRGASVSIPTPAWGTALARGTDEVVVAELMDDDVEPALRSETPPSGMPTATGGIPIPEPAAARAPVLGALAALGAIVTVVLHAAAVNVAAARDPETATTLAWAAIIMSFVAMVLGILAVVFRSGRWTGVIAVVVALIANPWVLLQILTFFAA